MNMMHIEKWLTKRYLQLENVRSRADVKRLVIENLRERRPLVLAEKNACAESLEVSRSLSHYSSSELLAVWHPYVTPCPFWKRDAWLKLQGRHEKALTTSCKRMMLPVTLPETPCRRKTRKKMEMHHIRDSSLSSSVDDKVIPPLQEATMSPPRTEAPEASLDL